MNEILRPNVCKNNIIRNKISLVKKKKILDEDFRILNYHEYENLNKYSYKVQQLKELCKHYNLKRSGNKNELTTKLYDYLKFSLHAIKIQSFVKGILLRKCLQLAGPALINRKLCINDSDFASLEKLNEISHNQFFSFIDKDNNIYGFDIISFNQLFPKKQKSISWEEWRSRSKDKKCTVINPYNRNEISIKTIKCFLKYLKYLKICNIKFEIENEEEIYDEETQQKFKITELFQKIDELGNYSDSKWFENLDRQQLILFIRELHDIWQYRAQLSIQTMREIVSPHGNPFHGVNLHLANAQDDNILKKKAIQIIENMVTLGTTNENKSLGSYYVLAALTLVSNDARMSLPWLYQSVSHY